mgnify:CR=1 FL=1
MTYVYMALIMSVVILGVTALVFWANQSKSKSDGSGYAAALAQKEAKAAEENKKMEFKKLFYLHNRFTEFII